MYGWTMSYKWGHPVATLPVTNGTILGVCDPAAKAWNAATSQMPQMRALLESTLRANALSSAHWLAVSVPREANYDADRLSHPTQLEGVLADARQAGLQPRVVEIPDDCWQALRWAMKADAGDEGAPAAKRRRLC
eukprot:310090-Pleurochrysis_carterae.AAC.2